VSWSRPASVSFLVLSLVLLLPSPSRAGPAALIPRAELFGNPVRLQARVSPDGKRLAYLRPDSTDVLQVWVKTLGRDDDRQVTHDPKRGILEHDWTWNGKLHYLQDNGGDENFHVFLTDVETGETRDLTPIAGVRAEVLANEPGHPDQMVVALNRRDRQLMEPWLVDLTSGALTLLAENPGKTRTWIIDADLRARGRVSVRPDGGSDLEVRDGDGAPWRTIVTVGLGMELKPLAFSQDGTTLYVETDLTSDTQGLYGVDVATGRMKLMASDPSADAGDVVLHPITHVPQAVAFDRLRPRWKQLDPSIAQDWAGIAKLTPGDFEITARDLADRRWIITASSDVGVVDYFLWDRDARQGTLLFNAQPKLRSYALAPMKPLEIKARDGLMLPSYLTLPLGLPARNLPLVMLVHGGPWWRDSWGFDPESQWLANRGYAVLKVNFRGSTGFGRSFANQARHQFAGKMHEDLLDAVDWVVRQGIADRKRVAIMGWSYGGYATLVGLSFTPDVFVCGVDGVGPSNLVTLVESFPPYWRPRLAARWYPFVGDPADSADRADMLARSPITRVDRIRSPLLVGQGANDPRVKKEQSDSMVASLRARGVPVEYLVFPDEGHGFVRPENNLKFYAAAEVFLAKYLGGRAEPAPPPKPEGSGS
jgi:dipeptidyl aminopeptidase/acylaminoacyl peptidase